MQKNSPAALKLLKTILWIYKILCVIIAGDDVFLDCLHRERLLLFPPAGDSAEPGYSIGFTEAAAKTRLKHRQAGTR